MSNCGFSLLELMISLFLSALLISSTMEMYLHFKWVYRQYTNQTQEYSEIRLAIFRINHWIRMAGFGKCANPESISTRKFLRGFNSKTIPRNWKINAKPNSGILVIWECTSYQGQMQFMKRAIYIGKTNRKSKSGKVIYALYEKIIPGRSEELAEFIKDIQFRFGIKNPKDKEIIAYQKAENINDWNSVGGVEYKINNSINAYTTLRQFSPSPLAGESRRGEIK